MLKLGFQQEIYNLQFVSCVFELIGYSLFEKLAVIGLLKVIGIQKNQ